MNYYPFCFTCPRDWRLFEMLEYSWRRIGRPEKWTVFHELDEPITTSRQVQYCEAYGVKIRSRKIKFAPWSGLGSGASKRLGWIEMLETPGIKDEDYIIHVDSDAVFYTPEILEVCREDFVGFPHSEAFTIPELGYRWEWYSGCFHAARVSLVRKLAALDEATILQYNREIMDNISRGFMVLDDSVMSYFFSRLGATRQPLSAFMQEGDPQRAFSYLPPRSFSHLNGMWTKFLGTEISGKWDIPDVVSQQTLFFKGGEQRG